MTDDHSVPPVNPLAQMRSLLLTLQSCDAGMNLQAATMLLAIANHEASNLSLTTADLAKFMSITATATSRLVYYLGEGIPASSIKGLNLVELRIDAIDRRRRTIHLTKKGKTLIEKLLKISMV